MATDDTKMEAKAEGEDTSSAGGSESSSLGNTLEKILRTLASGDDCCMSGSFKIQYMSDGGILLILDNYRNGGAPLEVKGDTTKVVAETPPAPKKDAKGAMASDSPAELGDD